MQAREEVLLEQYSTIVSIEARTLIMMLSTKVLPAALRYQGELASIISASTANSVDCSRSLARLGDVARLSESFQEAIELLQGLMNNEYEDSQEHANFVRDSLIPSMNVARTISDHLEELVPDDIWPLPSYTEMLFIRSFDQLFQLLYNFRRTSKILRLYVVKSTGKSLWLDSIR